LDAGGKGIIPLQQLKVYHNQGYFHYLTSRPRKHHVVDRTPGFAKELRKFCDIHENTKTLEKPFKNTK